MWQPFVHESADGYDAVEWLAAQDWSNGKVGMIGASYLGWAQLWAAVARPPHLVTIIPNVAPPDPFYNIPYEYGVFFILGAIWWAEILESKATADLSGQTMSKINERRYEKILRSLPVIDLDQKVFGHENKYWRLWILHNSNCGYWQKVNFMHKLAQIDIPVFLQSGWFDGDGIGSKLNYLQLQKSRHKCQKLVIGPWGHTPYASRRIGEYEFGEQAAIDLPTMYLRWFDRWLKGRPNNIDKEPLVQLFVMFANRWLTGSSYPLPGTRFEKFYLASSKGANTSAGDGRLTTALARSGKEFDSYLYNPGDPTPFPQYYFKSEKELEAEKKKVISVEEQHEKVLSFHQKVTGQRQDILVYQSTPLQQPLTVAGPLSAVIYASSDALDTDWFVSLMSVAPDGKIFYLARGMLRARFRNSLAKPELLTPGKVYCYHIDMWHTGIKFARNHRLRVEIASAMFPAFSRNLNTGKHNETETTYRTARQRIYHSPRYPSHILLPVIPSGK